MGGTWGVLENIYFNFFQALSCIFRLISNINKLDINSVVLIYKKNTFFLFFYIDYILHISIIYLYIYYHYIIFLLLGDQCITATKQKQQQPMTQYNKYSFTKNTFWKVKCYTVSISISININHSKSKLELWHNHKL